MFESAECCTCVAFLYMQWLPYNWWQAIYVAWRWFIALYFIGWLVGSVIEGARDGAYYLIFLTNWGIMTWVVYVIVAAVTVTVKFCFYAYETCTKVSLDAAQRDENTIEMIEASKNSPPQDSEVVDIYRDWRKDNVAWYQKIAWILFNVAPVVELAIAILYWAVLYNPTNAFNSLGVDVNTHLTPAVIGLLDVWITGIVMNIYHVYMPFAYGIVYVVFTLIYYGAGGTGPRAPYIYPILDYSGNPGLAAGVVIGCTLVYIPILYIVLYCISLLRRWLVSLFRKACYST